MRTHTIGRRWKPVLTGYSSRDKRRAGGIYPEYAMHELIMYEEARADRTGRNLALVLCDLSGVPARRRAARVIIRRLSAAARCTDHVGWLSKREIGILLPVTGKAGAESFLANLDLPGWAAQIRVSVYEYPAWWLGSSSARAQVRSEREPASETSPEGVRAGSRAELLRAAR